MSDNKSTTDGKLAILDLFAAELTTLTKLRFERKVGAMARSAVGRLSIWSPCDQSAHLSCYTCCPDSPV
jgi:hypothetical protein